MLRKMMREDGQESVSVDFGNMIAKEYNSRYNKKLGRPRKDIDEDETDYPDYNGQQFNYYVVF
jgi:hypothetical protein